MFREFLDFAFACAGAPQEKAAALAGAMLAGPAGPGAGRSTLNNDGVPLELCIGLGGARKTCRLIADPAFTEADAERRMARGREALGSLLAARGPGLRELCERTLAATLPVAADLASLRSGAMWLAAELDAPGLALYTTGNWGGEEARWERTLAWLDGVLGDTRAARGVIEPLRQVAHVVAHGIEGDEPRRSRAKLYLRARTPRPLAAMGLELLRDPWVGELLLRLIARAPIHSSTLVYSIGFAIEDGRLIDQKIDVCAHCTPRRPEQWNALLAWWSQARGMDGFGVEEALLSGVAEVAFVGLGVRADGELRTNLYLKPPATAVPSR